MTSQTGAHPLPGLFVTGTDTGVGKTIVATALARLALRAGLHPVPYKPVETGCDPTPLDAVALWNAAGRPLPLDLVTHSTFPLPAAPSVAAAAVGTSIDTDSLVQRADSLRTRGDFLLVEGAGGLLVPYRNGFTAADLAARLALPVLIVARASLGTINHTALTINELRRRSLPLAGVILSEGAPAAHQPWLDHAGQITAVTGVRPLGILPHVDRPDPDRLADALALALGGHGVAALLPKRASVAPG